MKQQKQNQHIIPKSKRDLISLKRRMRLMGELGWMHTFTPQKEVEENPTEQPLTDNSMDRKERGA